MAATAGRLAALYISISGVYQPVGGLRTRSLSFGNTNVDVTTADSAGRCRELLAGAGIQNCDIDAAGVYQGDAAMVTFIQAVNASSIQTLKYIIPGIIKVEGSFLIDSSKIDAPYNESLTFDLKALSSGLFTVSYGAAAA